MDRIREAELGKAVERYLHDAGGTATIAQIRRALPHYIELTEQDRQPSVTRPGEQIWEQQVRNIVCHRECAGNPVKAGELLYRPRHLALKDGPQGELF